MSGGAGVGHLSIGEVLSLVQEDFPDVTISKIRFLESQGLIAPERTAAGYRKFYDSDIERLRWILRQQRDHFLPLKVIRKMLDQGVDVSPDSEQPTLWSAAATGPAGGRRDGDPDDGSEDSEAMIDVSDGPRERPAGEEDCDDAELDSPRRRSAAHPAVASARPAASRSSSGTGHAAPASRPAAPAAPAQKAATGDPTAATAASAASTDAPTEDAGPATRGDAPAKASPDAPATRRASYTTPADVVAALQEEPRTRRPAARPRSSAEPPAPPGAATPPAGVTPPAGPPQEADVRMNRAELCDAAGLSPELLADLEDFGLVEPTVLGGDPQYDAGALAVARIAARYAELGVGARHLRMYKVAAEREAGFVEQLVVPLLKQRNPEARAEARKRAEELQQMGAQLHDSLLRRRLGPSFGG